MRIDSFDADVMIYAAEPGHPLGQRVRSLLLDSSADSHARIGSTLLLPAVLTRPTRLGPPADVEALAALLGRLDLHPVDRKVARLAVALGAAYGLKAPDAVHLATGVNAGADRFITNNRRDFPQTITEIEVTYPLDLAADI